MIAIFKKKKLYLKRNSLISDCFLQYPANTTLDVVKQQVTKISDHPHYKLQEKLFTISVSRKDKVFLITAFKVLGKSAIHHRFAFSHRMPYLTSLAVCVSGSVCVYVCVCVCVCVSVQVCVNVCFHVDKILIGIHL